MVQKSDIELELNKVTKIRRKKSEEKRAYLIRLIKAFDDITDDQWDTLSAEAQQWHNEAIKSWKKNQKPIDFPEAAQAAEDDPDEEEKPTTKRKASRKVSEDSESGDDEDEEEKSTSKKKKVSSKKKASATSKKPELKEQPQDDEDDAEPKKVSKSGKRARSVKDADSEPEEQIAVSGPGKSLRLKDQIKSHLIEDERKPLDEIFDAMQQANPNVAISRSTINGIAAEFRHSLKFLRERGMLR